MKPLLTLILSLLCLTAGASPGQPYFVRQQASSFTPQSVPGLAYWWVGSDVINSSVTNWTDRIQGKVFTSAGAAYPTLTGAAGAKGVHFTPSSYMTATPPVPYSPRLATNDPVLYIVFDSQPTDCYMLGATNASIRNYINNNAVSTGVQRFSWYINSAFLFRTNTILDVYCGYGGQLGQPREWTNGVPAATVGVDFGVNAWKTINGAGDSLGVGTGTFTVYEIAIWTNLAGTLYITNFVTNLHAYATNTYNFTP